MRLTRWSIEVNSIAAALEMTLRSLVMICERPAHAVLDGRSVSVEQMPSIGCNIKWIPGNEPEYFTGQPGRIIHRARLNWFSEAGQSSTGKFNYAVFH